MPRGIDGLEPQIWFTEFQGQKIGRIDPANDFLMTEFWPADPGCATLDGPLDLREIGPVWFTDSAADRIGKLWQDPSNPGTWYFSFWNVPTSTSAPWGIDVLLGPLLTPIVWSAEIASQPEQVA